MTIEQAEQVNIGDTITVAGLPYTVNGVKTTGIASPLFRLLPKGHDREEKGLTSYRLCSIPKSAE